MASIVLLCIALLILIPNSQSHRYCYPVAPPEHGFVDNTDGNRYYRFSCERGYSLKGETYIYCDDYDFKNAPKCIKNSESFQRCAPVSPPEHGFVENTGDNRFYQFSCKSGYSLEGQMYIYCDDYDSKEAPKCIKDSQYHQECRHISPPEHGIIEPIDIFKVYKFSCEDGYTLNGSTYLPCVEYDSKKAPKCIKNSQSDEHCYQISPPEHGFVKINEDNAHYKFSCEDGYTLSGSVHISCKEYDLKLKPKCVEHVCKALSSPQNGQVYCDEGLLVPGKTCRFSCSNGYRLQGTQSRLCKFNLQWSGSAVCYPIPNVCQNPLPPENGAVECEKGDLVVGKACRFSCSEGYQLQGAFVRRCMFNYHWSGAAYCVEKRESSYDKPAGHDNRVYHKTNEQYSQQETKSYNSLTKVTGDDDGCADHKCEQICRIEETGPHCRCCSGYKLNIDNITCRLNIPSRINHECLKLNSKKKDDVKVNKCAEGYILDKERKSCIDVNECDNNNFGCSDKCVNTPGRAYCSCSHGFKLDLDRKTCIDVDECLVEGRCQHFCNNTKGSYICYCRPGFILVDNRYCLGCKKNSHWSYQKNGCVDCPKNSHTDSEGKLSIDDCVCNSGFIKSPGEYFTCDDIDECMIKNFGCSNECRNILGSAYCLCPEGFELDTDNKTCIDIDECRIKNGGCEGLCINRNGGFHCVCLKGFKASEKNRYSCDDINECAENNGGCEHNCVNYRGGFYCTCKNGYHLDSTLKNCTDIQCPKLSQPHHSYMNCTYRDPVDKTLIVLPEKDSYPVNTKCTFKCYRGFKNTRDDNRLKCGRNSTWIGTLPECKAESCPPLNAPANGQIHPPSCSKYGSTVKEKCTFSCLAGYKLDGHGIFECKNDLTWNKDNIPVCNLEKIQPIIKCPQDIRVALEQGKAKQNITVSEPTTNMKYYEVHPPWVTANEPVEFQVGETKIIFTTTSPSNETAKCEMTVTVLDEEPPTFHYCPDPIQIEGAGGSGEFVTWDEPIVTDNVELASVFSLLEPNTTLSPGTYFVEYVAIDSSGNVGTCSFDISIVRMNCSDLRDPVHGKANCMDWMYGKLCNPECDAGYMRDPEESLYYSCDDTGVWEPNDSISECLQYTLATSPVCQEGFEFKKVDATEEEVCIECPSNAVWSATTRKCEK